MFTPFKKRIGYLVCSCSDISLKKIDLLIQNVVKVTFIDLVTVTDQESLCKKEVKRRQKTNRNDVSNLNI